MSGAAAESSCLDLQAAGRELTGNGVSLLKPQSLLSGTHLHHGNTVSPTGDHVIKHELMGAIQTLTGGSAVKVLLTALPEDSGSIPSTQTVDRPSLTPASGDSMLPSSGF